MLIPVYGIYFAASLALALWAGHALHQSGRVFLVETFKGDEAQADSINRMLLVGFYLFSFGFICLMFNHGPRPVTLDDSIEFLSTKLGLTVLTIGAMHFIGVFTRMLMRP